MKKRLLAMLLVLVCVCLSGCAVLEEQVFEMVATQVERTGLESPTRTIIDALLSRDIDLMLSALAPEFTKEDLQDHFEQMSVILPQAEEYTLTPTSWNTKTSNGVTQTTVQFLLAVADQTFIVETTSLSNVKRVAHFYIAPVQAEETIPAAKASGEVSPVETALAIIGVLEVIFVIWALVDCCRHKFHRKWLWVLAILLGNVLLLLDLNGSRLNFNLQFGLYLNGIFFKLHDGGFSLRLLFPVGSVAYLLRRKHLLVPKAQKGFAEAFQDVHSSTRVPSNNDQA